MKIDHKYRGKPGTVRFKAEETASYWIEVDSRLRVERQLERLREEERREDRRRRVRKEREEEPRDREMRNRDIRMDVPGRRDLV